MWDFVVFCEFVWDSRQKLLVIMIETRYTNGKESSREKSSVGVLREQSEQYPIFPSYKEDKMADNYDGMAVGVFELDNLVACFVALDAASKAANVKIQSVERNRLKSGACVKMRGSVSDVNAAMEVALETAKPLGKIVSHTVIASPTADTETALKMTINK